MKIDTVKMQIEPRLWEITERCYTGVELPERSFFQKCVEEGDIWVAITKNQIVGYALANLVYSGPLLRSVAVLEEYRGRGFGRFMLDEMARYYRLRGESKIVLHCKVDNPAQKLYFDAGYRVMGRLKDYYLPEGDGLKMEKIL